MDDHHPNSWDDAHPQSVHHDDNAWLAEHIHIPAQFTHYFSGEPYRTEVNLVEYMGKESKFLEHKKDPLMAEHVRLHVFPEITDDTNESVRIISKHVMTACAQDDGFAVCSGYTRSQNYLVFKCKRGKLYKSRRQPTTPAHHHTKIKTFLPLVKEHCCRFRFGFIYKDHQWFFNAGSGILSHSFHARRTFDAQQNPSFRIPKVPTGSDDEDDRRQSHNNPMIRLTPADQVVQKACGMTKMQWVNGQELWKDPNVSTSQTLDFVWHELCDVCDDSFHARAILQTHLARAIAECRAAQQQDPSRKSLRGSSTSSVAVVDNHTSMPAEGSMDDSTVSQTAGATVDHSRSQTDEGTMDNSININNTRLEMEDSFDL